MAQKVKVWLDKNFLQSTKGSGELLTNLEKNEIQTIIENLPIENSIFWTRVPKISKSLSTNSASGLNEEEEIQHDHILVKMELDAFVAYLENEEELLAFISTIKRKAQVTQITLLIQNFKHFCKDLRHTKSDIKAAESFNNLVKKKQSTKKSTKLTKSDLNSVLIELELHENVCVRSYETSDELKDLILSFTKAVGEYASKRDEDGQLLICVETAKSGGSQSNKNASTVSMWKEMLECFPMVSSDQAQAIASTYTSPLMLKNAYEEKSSSSSSSSPNILLADIQVRRGAGVLASVRRIGPELSQKVHKFMTSTNPNELLVNQNK